MECLKAGANADRCHGPLARLQDKTECSQSPYINTLHVNKQQQQCKIT